MKYGMHRTKYAAIGIFEEVVSRPISKKGSSYRVLVLQFRRLGLRFQGAPSHSQTPCAKKNLVTGFGFYSSVAWG